MNIRTLVFSFIGFAIGSIFGFLLFKWTVPSPILKRQSMTKTIVTPTVEEIRAKLPRPNIPIILSHGSTIDVKRTKWRLRDLSNRDIDFSQLAGQTIFVNSWGTWCLPCVAEMPSIQLLYDSLKNESIAFVVFSDEDMETIRSFTQREGLRLPFYMSMSEPPKPLVNKSWPTTFILNKTGSIVLSETGGADWSHPDVIRFIRNINK